jgi:hypothetical protein
MWTKSQAQAKFLTAAATIRFLIARPPSRPPSGHYIVTEQDETMTTVAATRKGISHSPGDGVNEEDGISSYAPLVSGGGGDQNGLDDHRRLLLMASTNSNSETSPRSRDSGNMSIDSETDKSFEVTRNRLSSSSSSKDSGHRSSGDGSIDRSTTNSSKSDASSSHDGSTVSDPGKQKHPAVGSMVMMAGDLKKSQSLFSIDSDFLFVSAKSMPVDDRQRMSIRPSSSSNHPMIVRKDCLNNINNNNNHLYQQQLNGTTMPAIIDPIYEIIHEQSEPEADMYCLPVDSMPAKPSVLPAKMAVGNSSPEHVGKKTRSRSSDQVKMLAKSTSGEFLPP